MKKKLYLCAQICVFMAKTRTNTKNRTVNHSGIWIMIIAALALEAISCTMYFTSRAAIKRAVEDRAQTELQKAEMEIEIHTMEIETAAKTLALLTEKHLAYPDSISEDTRLVVRALYTNTSLAVAFEPNYFPQKGEYFEICSSKFSDDSIYTRQIGSADHDYTEMDWYQDGLMRDSCWWSEPYMDDSGSKTWVVSCSYPVRDKTGRTVGVVCVDLSLDYMQHISENLKIIPGSYSAIRSNMGVHIVEAPDTVAGRKYIPYDEVIDATGWVIEIIIPEDELFKDLNRIGRIVGILMLIGLALLAMMVIYTSRTTKKLIRSMEKNQRMEGELHIASAIQTAMLPKVFPPFSDRLDINIYGKVTPAKEVGGDLYDFCVRQEKLFFCIGDVSGKGVPASLVMAMTRSLFRGAVAHEERADAIMCEMNKALTEQNSQNMFLTLFVGVLDCETGELHYCNAGHNAPVSLKHSAVSSQPSEISIQPLPVVANLPLGIMADFEFEAQTTQMQYDDLLFLYTDGLTEAEKEDHEQYGEERMMEVLKGLTDLNPRRIAEHMQASVESFVAGAKQSDDLTMLVLRYQRPAICMRNDIQQIPTLPEWIDTLDIPMEVSMPINLALEEIVSNVMLYAYPGKSGQVFVEFNRQKDAMVFTVSDNGVAFDPTQQAEVDTTLSVEERPIGGLGIHLVRQIMDEIRYERVEEKNILTLVKNLNTEN